jgi:hypothetical protein
MALKICNPFLQSFCGRQVSFLTGGERRLAPFFELVAPPNEDAFGEVVFAADLRRTLLTTGDC